MSSAALTCSPPLPEASQLILISSAELYMPPNIFAWVIYALAELFLRDYQSLICQINPIAQTGPLPIPTSFAHSIGAYMHHNCLYTPIYDYGKLSCLGPKFPAPLRSLIPTIHSSNCYSTTFFPISDSQFPQSLHLSIYASYALHSYISMPPLPPMILSSSLDDLKNP